MIRPSRNSILWMIATLAVALAPQLPRMPLAAALITVLPLAWRFAAEIKRWQPLPKLLRYIATALSLLTLVVAHGGLFGRRASVTLLAAMLALKLLETERIRDARLIVSFSFFLCATQFLFAQGVFMPVYGLATAVLGLVALTQLQRDEAFAPCGPAPPLRASILAELRFSGRLLALAVPAGLALFLLFPRWSTPMWGVPEATLDAKSGLSDTMSPGSIQNLFMDDSPAFRVEFDGRLPEPSELYWRGPVFWHYDGDSWTSSFYGRNIEAETLPPADGAAWHYTVQLEPNERHWLFALDYPTSAPRDTRITMDFQMLRQQPVLQLTQYSVSSNPSFVDAAELKPTLRSMALELPEGRNPRTHTLVQQWRRQFNDDAALIQHVLRYFNSEEFHYSLNSPLLGSDAVDEFLFETRTGYCEHYSSAFTLMMRMAGIPARVVTGYQGGWYSELGSYMLVRQSDAHAWSEVWLPGQGWTRVDPTAAVSPLRVQAGSLSALSDPRHLLDYAWLRQVRNGVDILEQRWNDWVIEFGAQRQARLLSSFGLDKLSPVKLVIALFAVLGVIGLILLPPILRTAGPGRKDPVQQLWQRFLKRLKAAGYRHRPSQAAMELAAEAAVKMPVESEQIYRIAGLYNRHRYAPEAPELAELRRAVRSFRPTKLTN